MSGMPVFSEMLHSRQVEIDFRPHEENTDAEVQPQHQHGYAGKTSVHGRES